MSPDRLAEMLDPDADGVPAPADCAPFDPDVPADEVAYDGVDNDCDPSTVDDDRDGDGVPAAEDCEDEDAAVYPGAADPCGDGIDSDCTTQCSASLGLYDTTDGPASARFGASVVWWGADLVVGAPLQGGGGAAWSISAEAGPGHAEDLIEAHAYISLSAGDQLGSAVVARDLDGDGVEELVIGAPGVDGSHVDGGAVFVLGQGSGSGALDAADAWTADGAAGTALAVLAGDTPVLAIGAPVAPSSAGGVAGGVYLTDSPFLAGELDGLIEGIDLDERAGTTLVGLDLDGDGQDSLVVGAPNGDGKLYLLEPSTAAPGPIVPDDTVEGAEGEAFGASLAAGDLDGDGHPDLLVGAPEADFEGAGAGAAYLLLAARGRLGEAVARYDGPIDASAGDSVCVVGDLVGEAGEDVAIGAPTATWGGARSGGVWFVPGTSRGVVELVSSAVAVTGEVAGDDAGSALAWHASLGLLVGAPLFDGGGEGGGAVYRVGSVGAEE